MNFLKKQSAGFYFTVLTIVAAVISVIFYMINCKTDYYISMGVNSALIVYLIVAAILEVVLVIGVNVKGYQRYFDVLPVLCGILLTIALVTFLRIRVNSIATILTFQKNDLTMADLTSALVGIGFSAGAVVLNILASFFKIVKE